MDGRVRSEVEERRTVSKLSRDELEDKYIRLYEEHLALKKKEKGQEDKMKRMATKLLRLTADKKEEEKHSHSGPTFGKFDTETKEVIEDLRSQVRTLLKRNDTLNSKLTVAKKQLETQSARRKTAFDHIKPRISTGLNQRPPLPLGAPDSPRRSSASVTPRYGHSLLEEARQEKAELEDVVMSLHDQIQILQDEASQTAQHIRSLELEHESELLQLQEKLSSSQRANIQEDVGLIRLQREVKERAVKYDSLQAQYLSLQQNMDVVKASHARLLEQIEELDTHLKEEQLKNTRLQNQLKSGSATEQQIAELHEMISDLRSEKNLLKQTNDKLIKRAFDTEREQQHKQQVLILQTRLEQMEATHHADLKEKSQALDMLSAEREQREQLDAEHRERNIAYYQLKQEHDDLVEKMKFFTKESAVDLREIEEALVLIKMRREKGQQSFDFIEKVDEVTDKEKAELQRLVAELRASHADTISELDKTRKLLSMQHKLNKEYQAEVETVTCRMDAVQRECGVRVKEYAELVDIKTARIKKLEGQLHDIAYGTRQYKIDKTVSDEELNDAVSLERGQNLFEIHIGQLSMSHEMLVEVKDPSQLVTLVSFGFYEYDTQFSPVIRGLNPDYDFTAQYVVQVDDFFLHYLQKESCTLEIHQVFGTEYQTLAASQLRFQDLLDANGGRVHCQSKLAGVLGSPHAESVGTINYWIRLRIPMDQALRLFKERNKALGYLGQDGAMPSAVPLNPQVATYSTRVDHLREDYNELNIQLVRCVGLQANRKNELPSPYAIYKFYDFADHDTGIIQHSGSPEFNDSHVYPILMNSELDRYIKSQALTVYVFDDADNEQSAYLGSASVPLLPLAHNNEITGTFELIEGGSGVQNGAVEVNLYWQRDYRLLDLPEIPTGLNLTEPVGQVETQSKDTVDPWQTEPLALQVEAVPMQSALPEKTLSEEDTDDWSGQGEDVVDYQDIKRVDNQQPVPSNGVIQMKGPDAPGSDFDSGSDDIVMGADSHPSRAAPPTAATPTVTSESDEDGLVVSPCPPSQQRDSTSQLSPSVTVVVWSLSLHEDAPVLSDNSVQQLFVEYKFLTCDAAELETPFSLPKKSAGYTMSYNFQKVFYLDDPNHHYRQDLMDMMSQDHSSRGCIQFTVVSEPPEDYQDSECIDIGSATVDLHTILGNRDVQEESIDVCDMGDPELIIGTLNVTVEALSALKDIQRR